MSQNYGHILSIVHYIDLTLALLKFVVNFVKGRIRNRFLFLDGRIRIRGFLTVGSSSFSFIVGSCFFSRSSEPDPGKLLPYWQPWSHIHMELIHTNK